MEHVVFYPADDGPAYRRVSSLDDAVGFVEHLRNVENITDFSVHALTPVELSLRAYYHVQVPGTPEESGESTPSNAVSDPESVTEPDVVAEVAEAADVEPAVDAVVVTEPVAEEVAIDESVVDEVVEEPAVEVDAVAVADEPAAAVAVEVVEAAETVDVAETVEVADVPVMEAIEVAEAAAPEPVLPFAEPIVADVAPIEPVEAVADEDRSAEWVAEATIVEAPAVPVVEAPAPIKVAAEVPAIRPVPDEAVVAAPVVSATVTQSSPQSLTWSRHPRRLAGEPWASLLADNRR